MPINFSGLELIIRLQTRQFFHLNNSDLLECEKPNQNHTESQNLQTTQSKTFACIICGLLAGACTGRGGEWGPEDACVG